MLYYAMFTYDQYTISIQCMIWKLIEKTKKNVEIVKMCTPSTK